MELIVKIKKMVETLKDNINVYINNFLDEPNNLEFMSKTFSDEVIIFPDTLMSNSTFVFSSFQNSHLRNIKFINANFNYSWFDNCLLENCSFENTILNLTKFTNCKLKNCRIIDCPINESDFIKTIFDQCEFQAIKKGSFGQNCFESCHFIKTIFDNYKGLQIGSTAIINSKFSNSKQSIEFKGEFYLMYILQPVTEMLFE